MHVERIRGDKELSAKKSHLKRKSKCLSNVVHDTFIENMAKFDWFFSEFPQSKLLLSSFVFPLRLSWNKECYIALDYYSSNEYTTMKNQRDSALSVLNISLCVSWPWFPIP